MESVYLVWKVRGLESELIAVFGTRQAAAAFADQQADIEHARNWASLTQWTVETQEVRK